MQRVIGLHVGKPNEVPERVCQKKKKTKWRTHNQEAVACPVPSAIGRLLDFVGERR